MIQEVELENLHEIVGDLFTTDADIIVHGCNCQGKMNSGVAKLIRQKYPEAYKEYMEYYKTIGLELGTIYPCFTTKDGKIIVNAITQDKYGHDGLTYVDYEAVKRCFKYISKLVKNLESAHYPKKYSIAMPKIGCGLGGGRYDYIKTLIMEELHEHEVFVYGDDFSDGFKVYNIFN